MTLLFEYRPNRNESGVIREKEKILAPFVHLFDGEIAETVIDRN